MFCIFQSKFILLRRSISLISSMSVLRCSFIISLHMSILCCSLSTPSRSKMFSFILNNTLPVMSCLKRYEQTILFSFFLSFKREKLLQTQQNSRLSDIRYCAQKILQSRGMKRKAESKNR